MATGNFTLYDATKLNMVNGTINLGSDTFAMALLQPGYTPSASHTTWADVSAQQITDSDYA
jgi:hypothetical protein